MQGSSSLRIGSAAFPPRHFTNWQLWSNDKPCVDPVVPIKDGPRMQLEFDVFAIAMYVGIRTTTLNQGGAGPERANAALLLLLLAYGSFPPFAPRTNEQWPRPRPKPSKSKKIERGKTCKCQLSPPVRITFFPRGSNTYTPGSFHDLCASTVHRRV